MIAQMRTDDRPEVGKVFADARDLTETYRVDAVLSVKKVKGGHDRHGVRIWLNVWEVIQTRVTMNWETKEWMAVTD